MATSGCRSGLHSTGYLQCALVLQHPAHAEALGREIARATAELRPTVVLSPALGGVVIGHEVARALGVRALFAERQDGVLTLRRGFVLADNDRVLVVEDVLTTGDRRAKRSRSRSRPAGKSSERRRSWTGAAGRPPSTFRSTRSCCGPARPTSRTPARSAPRAWRW